MISENSKYFYAVLKLIEDLYKTEAASEINRKTVARFTDTLTKKNDEIGTFQALENQVVYFLQNFSFAGKIDFSAVQVKLSQLPVLSQKLSAMVVEAKKMKDMPDRYNCHEALKVCRKLTYFCGYEMKIDDLDRVTAEIDIHIQKLLAIQKEFVKERQISADIDRLLYQHDAVLKKHNAFIMEIEQVRADFPKNRDTCLTTINQKLIKLNEVDQLSRQIDGLIAQVQNFADRHQKNATLQQASQLLIFARTQMKYNDANKVKNDFGATIVRLRQLLGDFDKEAEAVNQMLGSLQQRTPDCWKEENEQLISELKSISSQVSRKSNFSLRDFQNRIQKARDKKKQDIATFEQYNGSWLKRCRNKERLDTEIRYKYVSSDDFKKFIDSREGTFKQFINKLIYNN